MKSSFEIYIEKEYMLGYTEKKKGEEIFPKLEEMYGVRFLIPKYSEYRTAIGAALTYMDGAPIHPIK